MEEKLKLSTGWQERVSHAGMWGGKSQYKDLIVEMGLTYSKKKKKANVAGGWTVEKFRDKVGERERD